MRNLLIAIFIAFWHNLIGQVTYLSSVDKVLKTANHAKDPDIRVALLIEKEIVQIKLEIEESTKDTNISLQEQMNSLSYELELIQNLYLEWCE